MHSIRILPSYLLLLFSSLPSTHSHAAQHASSSSSEVLDTTPAPAAFFPQHQSERVKIRYGPYPVPSMHDANGMLGFGGTVVPAPCTACLITYMHAGLEYADGRPADARTGMWLHHTVWTNLDREGPTCAGEKRSGGDHFFASGNERTPVDLTVGGSVKAGYEVRVGDRIAMGGELMNMRVEEREVLLTMVFEFVPRAPKQFQRVRSYWLDAGGCQTSSLAAREDEAWEYNSPSWKMQDWGRIVFAGSHLHDGGMHTEIRQGGKVICDSQASYGTCHDDEEEEEERHIEALSACTDVGTTTPGDEWSITAFYNTSMHVPMRNMDGSLEPVMGIGLVYVALDNGHHRHKKLKVFLGLGVVALSAALVVMWANMNGRDWLLRKRQGIFWDAADTKSTWSVLGERYRDDA